MGDGLRSALFIKRMEQDYIRIKLTYAKKKKEFENRDSIIFNQPAQPPATNVHDT